MKVFERNKTGKIRGFEFIAIENIIIKYSKRKPLLLNNFTQHKDITIFLKAI